MTEGVLTLDRLREMRLDLPKLVRYEGALRRFGQWDAAELVSAEIEMRLALQSAWARSLPGVGEWTGQVLW